MDFDVITLFPEIVEAPLKRTILARAAEEGLITVRTHQLRDFAEGPHRRVDDQPYGGGGGMVMKPDPIFAAVRRVREQHPSTCSRTILLSTRAGASITRRR
jgi:tRNA (guanine37-N1)-methyltransferase